LFETAKDLQDGGYLGHIPLAAATIFPAVDVDERVWPKHGAWKVLTLVPRLRDIRAIQDLLVVETEVGEDAYGWVHPVLHVQEVLLVSQQT
jgi:hypothetical protein